MLRRRVESLSANENRPPSSFVPLSTTAAYPHVSVHRSLQLEARIHSPSVKVVSPQGKRIMTPVFGDGDKVGGTVALDPSCAQSGRLSISIEGAFLFTESETQEQIGGTSINADRRKHIFFSSARTIHVSPSSEFLPMRTSFKDALSSTIRRRPSASSLNLKQNPNGDRVYPFEFDLPRGCRSGEELPPTFKASSAPTATHADRDLPSGSGGSNVTSSGSFGVEYKISVAWEPTDASEYPSFLDVPIYYYSDADFQSVDCSPKEHSSWLEMPLRSDRPMPFRCAITLPTSVTFSRTSSIPYYVVFTTIPRSLTLTREIASDATISVTLLRKITVTEQSSLPPTPPQTPSSASEESDSPRGNLLKRVVRSRAGSFTWSPKTPADEAFDREKPLPRLPMHTVFTESRPLHTSICIGFPKRPRHQAGPEKHPTLDSQAALPDGLHKAKFVLSKNMLPSIDWSGVSVKYYLDVSVLVGQDDVRARVPIRVV
ncbi:hypothetical protein WG66_006559 [Moniliophthora roreri]|uniref:Uncharacterized protein n=1 Tax=Moniliophthora roreri TaxID=221103 RepID=A0A0W0FT43_MONRR|nr:hypothetical protein WG66_006559 [Moniliophthora roreri]